MIKYKCGEYMYSKIDELVQAISEDDIFLEYVQAQKNLNNEKTLALLSRHQMIQDDYVRMKRYENYVPIDDVKASLKEVKKEMLDDENVQYYYEKYYVLNQLLEDVTKIVFDQISDELVVSRWKV